MLQQAEKDIRIKERYVRNLEHYIEMLEFAGCPTDSPELVQCKKRLAKAKQSSAYVA